MIMSRGGVLEIRNHLDLKKTVKFELSKAVNGERRKADDTLETSQELDTIGI
jgi:hypothetical protein